MLGALGETLVMTLRDGMRILGPSSKVCLAACEGAVTGCRVTQTLVASGRSVTSLEPGLSKLSSVTWPWLEGASA
jgi:hypothetical protein